MRRLALLPLAIFAVAIAFANDPHEVLRTKEDTYKPLKLTKDQAGAMHKVDAKYGA